MMLLDLIAIAGGGAQLVDMIVLLCAPKEERAVKLHYHWPRIILVAYAVNLCYLLVRLALLAGANVGTGANAGV